MDSRWLGAAAVAGALVISQIPRLGSLAPVLVAALLLVGNVALVRWRATSRRAALLDGRSFAAPLAACWLLVALLPNHTFSHKPISSAGPSVDLESLVQVFACAGAALVGLAAIRSMEPTLERSRPPVVLFLLPLWTMASSTWSASGPYAFIRGAQLAAVAVLGWATIAMARVDRRSLDDLLQLVLRWFVFITLGLIVLGVLFGPRFVRASEANLDRFTWIGAHPLSSGLILSVALLVAAVTPARLLRIPPWGRLAVVAVLVAALIPNHSRQSWVGLGVALLVGLMLSGTLPPVARSVVAPLCGAVVLGAVLLQGAALSDYLLRNEDTDTLSTGNGRLDLWGIGFRALDSPRDWLIGLGHGITRTVFEVEAPWAHSAHSSFLAAIVSLGIIGLALLLALLVVAARNVIVTRLWRTELHGLLLTLLLVFLLVNGLVADNLVIPNTGFTMLCLIICVGTVERERLRAGRAAEAAPRSNLRDAVR